MASPESFEKTIDSLQKLGWVLSPPKDLPPSAISSYAAILLAGQLVATPASSRWKSVWEVVQKNAKGVRNLAETNTETNRVDWFHIPETGSILRIAAQRFPRVQKITCKFALNSDEVISEVNQILQASNTGWEELTPIVSLKWKKQEIGSLIVWYHPLIVDAERVSELVGEDFSVSFIAEAGATQVQEVTQ